MRDELCHIRKALHMQSMDGSFEHAANLLGHVGRRFVTPFDLHGARVDLFSLFLRSRERQALLSWQFILLSA